jgi:glycosidase
MRRLLLVLALALVASCTGAGTSEPESDLPWWNDRVFYEVFVRSFKDSNGDGIGDLVGLTESLDYLNDGDPATTDDLGITGIWLMPIFPSPSYHGYDVTDYRSVNPEYGSMEDFEAFLDAAHERGIAVLIDLVMNHTSVEHPWFLASAEGDPEYADWYVWSDTDPGTASPWSGEPAWHPLGDRYYYGLFWEGMPDLNVENADVTAELYDIARFWLEKGVDGFRLDAVRHLIERGEVLSDTPESVAWLEDFNDYVDSIAPEALVLGEVWSPTTVVAGYVPEALDLAFEFGLAEAGAEAVATQDADPFEAALDLTLASYPDLQYAIFLTNHDMNRIMSEVGGDVRLAKLAATWLLTGPGVPFLYYGEEVGLQGVKPDERIRTPMPWTAEEPGLGFTTGTPWEPPFEGFERFNVAAQTDDPGSLLSHYRTLIQAREGIPALRRGDLIPVETSSDTVTAYLRSEGDDHVLVVLNLAPGYAVDVALDLQAGPLEGMRGVTPLAGPPATAPEVGPSGGFAGYRPIESIPPFGYLVLRFGTEPSEPPPVTTTTLATTTTTRAATAADVAVVEGLLDSVVAGEFEKVLELVAPEAVVVDQAGNRLGLSDEIPPEAGFDETWDWNGDGTVTVGDLLVGHNTWGAVILTGFERDCGPSEGRVVCEISQTDVFGDDAGLGPEQVSQSYLVEGGLIVEFSLGESSRTPEDSQAWLGRFGAYETWVSMIHPELYDVVFRGPCCVGTPEGMLFTSASVEAQRELIPEWVETR